MCDAPYGAIAIYIVRDNNLSFIPLWCFWRQLSIFSVCYYAHILIAWLPVWLSLVSKPACCPHSMRQKHSISHKHGNLITIQNNSISRAENVTAWRNLNTKVGLCFVREVATHKLHQQRYPHRQHQLLQNEPAWECVLRRYPRFALFMFSPVGSSLYRVAESFLVYCSSS